MRGPLKRRRNNIRPEPIRSYTNDIVLIQQFHIPKHPTRYKEIQDTLRRNSCNKQFTKIYLLNERHYTSKELGFENGTIPPVIHQIDIRSRLTYRIAFKFVIKFLKDTWCIVSNNDIYYDDTLSKIPELMSRKKETDLKRFICLQRYELNSNQSIIPFERAYRGAPTGCAQDSWIFYSNECPLPIIETNINLGIPGCDNRIAYIVAKLQRYYTFNPPSKIISYHNHRSQMREYKKGNKLIVKKIPGPYLFLPPI